MTSTSTITAPKSRTTIRRVGLVLATALAVLGAIPSLIGISDVVSLAIGIFSTGIAVATLVLLVPAWRGRRAPALATAILQLGAILPALPAFFLPSDEVPAGNVVLAAVGSLLNVLAAVLILVGLPRRR